MGGWEEERFYAERLRDVLSADPAVQIADHYHFRRPISDSGVNYVARTYPYGGTSGGSLQVHHGVDMENPRGTPILAAAAG